MGCFHIELLIIKLVIGIIVLIALMMKVDGEDLTLVPYSNGSDVVRAVIAKITFSNISFLPESGEVAPFMRTMAYVETRDGTQLNPSGGGIWNISEIMFISLMNDRRGYEAIIQELERDHPRNYVDLLSWDNLTYSDLNTPMYSGLVARLIMHSNHGSLPGAGDFSHYWQNVFGSDRISKSEDKWIMDAQMLADEEACLVDTDLVFVLDTSGSIGPDNFQQVRSFVHDFSTELLPSMQSQDTMSRSRLGIITFNETANEYIALNTTIDRNRVLELILDIPYHGGNTNTGAGLELMRLQDWRDEVSILRVAMVVTDGKSNIGVPVENVSRAVHNHVPPIVVYAIGVGDGVNNEELETIASRMETSSHIDSFTSQTFDSITTTYSYQICFTESQDVRFSELESGSLDRDASIRLRFLASVINGLTFRICIEQGTIVVYASILPNPSSAQYGWRGVANNDPTKFSCLTMFFDILGETNNQVSQNNGRRKKRQLSDLPSGSIPFYITLEGQDDINVFNFNSSEGNISIDENECERDPCDPNAECFNTDGSFYCMCSEDYTGNGITCLLNASERSTTIITIVIVLALVLSLGIVIFLTVMFLVMKFFNRKKSTADNLTVLL